MAVRAIAERGLQKNDEARMTNDERMTNDFAALKRKFLNR